MTLYLIGLGLEDEKDITLRGLEAVKKCSKVYLENYTSLLQCTKEDLEQLYQQKINFANRAQSENFDQHILTEAKTQDVAFLIVGDPVAATTHIELFKQAKEQGIPVRVIHNASILTAVGITGLQVYKFGRTTSIPFLEKVPQLETPYLVVKENQEKDLHTLLLLDLDPEQDHFMTPNEAIGILEHIEGQKKEEIITGDTLVIACARVGTATQLIKTGRLEDVKKIDFGKPPYCLIIPAKRLHFVEEEMVGLWR